MKFEDWLKTNSDKNYITLLTEILEIEDPEFFNEWAGKQRLKEYTSDWAMFAIFALDVRIKELEAKQKKDKK